MHSNSIIKN